MCGAWLKRTCDSFGYPYTRCQARSRPLFWMAVTCWMSGLSVAIASWQIMHVLTLGRPATGPLVTPSWQYSVQVRPFSMCVLCGKGIGCDAAGRILKKSRVACDSVGRAVVNTPPASDDPEVDVGDGVAVACGACADGCAPQAIAASAHAATKAALRGCATDAAIDYFCRLCR